MEEIYGRKKKIRKEKYEENDSSEIRSQKITENQKSKNYKKKKKISEEKEEKNGSNERRSQKITKKGRNEKKE